MDYSKAIQTAGRRSMTGQSIVPAGRSLPVVVLDEAERNLDNSWFKDDCLHRPVKCTPLLPVMICDREAYESRSSNQVFPETEGVLKKSHVKQTDASGALSTFCLALSRFLLVCTIVLVAVMPWTEYFWHFDRFLHAGEDCELGLLALLAVLCLVLLLFQQGKNSQEVCFTVRHRFGTRLGSELAWIMPNSISNAITPYDAMALQSCRLDKRSLPLQV